MPTGYTADIAKGISFEKFVMNCARAFGALVAMRDESHDAEIPKEFKSSTYHKGRLVEIEKELLEVRRMTARQASAKAKQNFEEELKDIEKGIREASGLRAKYSSMLTKVRAWQPPSSDHAKLKEFMEEQITGSIKFDCSTKYYTDKNPTLLSGQQWKEQRIAKLMKDFAYTYNKKEHCKEIERIAGNNTWIRQLRESLAV